VYSKSAALISFVYNMTGFGDIVLIFASFWNGKQKGLSYHRYFGYVTSMQAVQVWLI
jgi:hypothetical protein